MTLMLCSLVAAHNHAVAATAYVKPSAVDTEKTDALGFTYGVKQCTYAVPTTSAGCSIQSTAWKLCACEYTVPIETCSSYGYDTLCYSPGSFFSEFGWGNSAKVVGTSAAALVVETYSDFVSDPPDCPEQAKAVSTYDCSAKQATCTKKTWYYDGDKDGKGDPFVTKYECNAPGSDWVLTAGDDCPTVAGTFVRTSLCKDQDGDGYPSNSSEYACLGDPKYSKYVDCSLESPDFWEGFTSDCDDNNPTITKKESYCYDGDKDLFCEGKGGAITSFLSCPKDSPYIPTSTANKGVDCDDKADFKYPGAAWVKDADWDGYYSILTAQCEDPGPEWYNVAWHLKNKGKTFLPGDECDTIKEIQKKEKFCKDADMDSYLDQGTCKYMCWVPGYDNPQGWFQPNDKWDCPGTVADSNPAWNPKSQWGIDCDGDGFYDVGEVKTGCSKLAPPAYCASADHPDKESDDFHSPEYYLLGTTKGGGAGLQPGDCDDTNPDITSLSYTFADGDGDGLGSPAIAYAMNCAAGGFSGELPGSIGGEFPSSISGEFPGSKGSPYPNDLDPFTTTGTMQKNVLSSMRAVWFIIAPESELAPCATKLSASLTAGLSCHPLGKLCAIAYSATGEPRIECIPPAWVTTRCPQLMATDLNPELVLSTDLDNFASYPYGTAHPILTEQQAIDAGLPIQVAQGPLLWMCLLDATNAAKTNYLHPLRGLVIVQETGQIFAITYNTSDKLGASLKLIPQTGADYKIDFALYSAQLAAATPPQTIPAFVVSQTELAMLADAKTYADSVKDTGWWMVPVNVPSNFNTTMPWYLYLDQLYQIPLTPKHPPWLEITSRLSRLPSSDDPYLLTFAEGTEVDSDHDGFSDLFEMTLPGVEPAFAKKMANDKTLFPKLLDENVLAVPQAMFLSPQDLFLWNKAKARAIDLVEPVFAHTQELLKNNPDVLLLLTPEEWKAHILKAEPQYLWYGPITAEDWVEPSNLLRRMNGRMDGCGPDGGNICIDLFTCKEFLATGMMPSAIFNSLTTEMNLINFTATVLIHEILHHHLELADPNKGPQVDLEHLFIFAITGWSLDFGLQID